MYLQQAPQNQHKLNIFLDRYSLTSHLPRHLPDIHPTSTRHLPFKMADMNCPICLEVFGTTGLPIMMSSGHFYCIRCVYIILYKGKNFIDPQTREALEDSCFLVPRVINQVREYREATGLDNTLMKVDRYGRYNVWNILEGAVFDNAVILKDYNFILSMLPSNSFNDRNFPQIWGRIVMLGLHQVIERASFDLGKVAIVEYINSAIEQNHWRTIVALIEKSEKNKISNQAEDFMMLCIARKRTKCLIMFVDYARTDALINMLVCLRSPRIGLGRCKCQLKIIKVLLDRNLRRPLDSARTFCVNYEISDVLKDFCNKGLVSYVKEILNNPGFSRGDGSLLDECLVSAVRSGRVEMSRFLIANGSRVSCKIGMINASSPLAWCIAGTRPARRGQPPRIFTKLISMLIDHGAEDDGIMRVVAHSRSMKLLLFIESQKICHPGVNLGTYEDAMIGALKEGIPSMVRYLGKKMNVRESTAVSDYIAGEDVISTMKRFNPSTWKAYCKVSLH